MVATREPRLSRRWVTPLFNYFVIALLCFAAAAASFHGYYSKWGMREGAQTFSLKMMFDGTAHRPWAYRQLMPSVASAVDAALPASIKAPIADKLLEAADRLTFDRQVEEGPPLAREPAYVIRYYLVYHMAFASLFGASLLLVRLCLMHGLSLAGSLLGSVLFLLLLPFLLSKGGYYYDLGELFFMAAYLVLLLDRRWRLACIPLAIVATVNKESFLFFILTTLPLCLTYGQGLKGVLRDRPGIAITIAAAVAAAAAHAIMLADFDHVAGNEVQFWLVENVLFYLDPRSLFHIEQTYGLFAFAGYSPVMLALLIGTAIIALPRLSMKVRCYAGMTALVSLPLFLLFAYSGETRNLSFFYPVTVLFLGVTFDWILAQSTHFRAAQSPAA